MPIELRKIRLGVPEVVFFGWQIVFVKSIDDEMFVRNASNLKIERNPGFHIRVRPDRQYLLLEIKMIYKKSVYYSKVTKIQKFFQQKFKSRLYNL